LLDQVITGGLGSLLGVLSLSLQVLLKVINSPCIEGPRRPAGLSLVLVKANLLDQFVLLATLRDRDAARI
jgi:hypothetical protein